MIIARLLRSRVRRVVALLAVVVVALGLTLAVSSTPPDTVTMRTQTIEVPGGPGIGGTIQLDAALYLPAVTPAPAVILAHGFGGSRLTVDEDARRLAAAGLVALAYSARGFGESGGLIGLDSLSYEVADARALVDWLASQPEVTHDGQGDPRVGVTGGSYGGALSLMLAGTDPRIDAVAAVATWNDLQQALFPNTATADPADSPTSSPAAVPAGEDGVFKRTWAATLLGSVIAAPGNSPASASALGCGRLMPDICAAYIQVAETGRLTPAMATILAQSSPAQVVDQISAPTLLVQGEQDTLFGLDQADATARAIADNGTPVAVSWYPGGHSGGPVDEMSQNRITEWLTHYLTGKGPEPSRSFDYAVAGPVTSRGQAQFRTLSADSYPGLSADDPTPNLSLRVRGPEQTVINPPGGQPAALTSLPGLGSIASATSGLGALGGLAVLPGQVAVFVTDPLEASTVITGSISLDVSIASVGVPGADVSATDDRPVLYASLASSSDLPTVAAATPATSPTPGPDEPGGGAAAAAGTAAGGLPAGGAVAAFRLDPPTADGSPQTVRVTLPSVALQVAKGDVLIVRISTTDQGFAGSTAPAVYRIAVAPDQGGDGFATVSVPAVPGSRIAGDGNPVGFALAAGAIVLIGGGLLWWVGRRRKDSVTSPDADSGEAAPLVVTSLRKAYPGGVTAVHDVSFTVQRGQVLGLLGPNGAGKTTTLRMVMGLITPSGGEVRLFGSVVSPGAAVLRRVGSFVEGSGFLPHLSGRRNLELYWRATGRPHDEAFTGQALHIAGLGRAVDRKVKTYSQGMRQRLAIAQAMLGLPELLILDEPTNGLDPPQIHAMREVLRRYAATGRTVVVSSHLLSEVEQTCTHVVIVSGGRTIASGTVDDLVAASGELLIVTDDPAAARTAIGDLPGLGEMEIVSGGLAVDRGAASVSELLRSLVEASVPVQSIAPRNRLEEVFLDLVGAGSTGRTAGGGD